jgi:2-polyprenyl-3-methyl-5-hydroxy-6-metoxy-1,4-benzoquinol methylase
VIVGEPSYWGQSFLPEIKRTFDRTGDVPKLIGANTRNVEYRWTTFSQYLDDTPPGSEILDYGAGSLRETWDLAQRGYRVTAVDLDLNLIEAYSKSYDWSGVRYQPAFLPLSELPSLPGRFSIITAFDVLEHLADPVATMRHLGALLEDGGYLFSTVPNGRSLFELSFRLDLRLARVTGRELTPGEPHLQRNSPARWDALFLEAGFEITEHDMAIGVLANTWNALIQVPALLVGRVLRRFAIDFPSMAIVNTLCHPRLMRVLDSADERIRSRASGLFGWNLIVARRPRT